MPVNKLVLAGVCAFFVCFAASFYSPLLASSGCDSRACSKQQGHALSQATGPGWSTVQELVATFKATESLSEGQIRQNLASSKTISALIDYRQIAMRSMGTSGWQSLSAAQQRDMTQTIQLLVQNRFYPRWQKIFSLGEVSYVGQSFRNGDIIVASNLHLGKKDESLTWQLSAGPKPKVVSLCVDKNDLLIRLTQRIEAHRAKGGYPAMIAWLKGRGKSKVDIADGDEPLAQPNDSASLKTCARSIDLID